MLCLDQHLDAGKAALIYARRTLEEYIDSDPEFRSTHSPYRIPSDSPVLIKKMCEETMKVGVGPMASVAGAFAHACLMSLIEAGAKGSVVDNGGDIAMFIREPIRVGIFSGNASIPNLAFEIVPRDKPFGICTSSGTVGHSTSYGKANAAVVVSSNIILADASATALGNRVKETGDLNTCFDFLKHLDEIEGALVILDDRLALWGDLPKLERSRIDVDLITKGKEGYSWSS